MGKQMKLRTMADHMHSVVAHGLNVRAGLVTWGPWKYVPELLCIEHEDGYQIDLDHCRSGLVLAQALFHVTDKRGAYSATDAGHLVHAFSDVFGLRGHMSAEIEPLHLLSPNDLTTSLPAPLTRSPIAGVYAVREAGSPMVKIGKSGNIRDRIGSLQTANPRKLELVAILSTKQSDEAGIHARLSQARVSGEWFRLCDQVAYLVRESRRRFSLETFQLEVR